MSKTSEAIKRTEEWLDERYDIFNMYYRGAVKAVEFMGYEWRRHENGKHTILPM